MQCFNIFQKLNIICNCFRCHRFQMIGIDCICTSVTWFTVPLRVQLLYRQMFWQHCDLQNMCRYIGILFDTYNIYPSIENCRTSQMTNKLFILCHTFSELLLSDSAGGWYNFNWLSQWIYIISLYNAFLVLIAQGSTYCSQHNSLFFLLFFF